MRYYLIIINFVFSFPEHAFCQKLIESKKIILHAPFKKIFETHLEVKEIDFKKYRNSDPELTIVETKTHVFKSLNQFDLTKPGDRYFFNKRFGTFFFPDSVYEKFIDNKADNVKVSGKIRQDSIFITIEQIYYGKSDGVATDNDDDIIFEKVELGADYEKGMHELAKELEVSLKKQLAKESTKDSVYIFQVIITAKDKKLKVDKTLTNNGRSAFAKDLEQALNTSGPWRPMQACGRYVNAYKQIYVQVLRDNTIILALD